MKLKSYFHFILTIGLLGVNINAFATDPVAYYPFNGNANDESGNGNDGTVNGATLTTDRFGNENSAYEFDGVDNYIEIPADNLKLNEYTYSVWVYLNSYPTEGNRFCFLSAGSYSGDQAVTYNNNYNPVTGVYLNGLSFHSYNTSTLNNSIYDEAEAEPDKWYHLVAVRSDNSIKLYINGALIETVNTTYKPYYGSGTIKAKIGIRWDNTLPFDGKIDDVKIYNIPLSKTEIEDLYNQEKQKNELVAYYPFNGNANDESGNGNDGTVNGATLTTDRFGNENRAYEFSALSKDFIELPGDNFQFNEYTYSVWACLNTLPTGVDSRNCALSIGSENPDSVQNRDQAITYNNFWNHPSGIFNGWGTHSYKNEKVPDSIYTGTVAEINKWYHLISVRADNYLKFYVNGKLVDSIYSTNIPSYGTETKKAKIGIRWNNTLPFDGKLDDIRVYNKAISQTEIDKLYNNEKPSLVAYYPFNSNANDESGNGNDGTINGATLTTDRFGNENSAYLFDGTNDYISLPSDFDTEEKTISVWFSAYDIPVWDYENDPVGSLNSIINCDHPNLKYGSTYTSVSNFDGIDKVWFQTGGMSEKVTAEIKKSEWYNLSVTISSSKTKVYLNGEIIDSVELSNHINSVDGYTNLFIGTSRLKNNRFFEGKIDDIRIYNKVLSQSEIEDLYNEEKPKNPLVAYYPFNGNANDESGNGNDGTVNGATLTTDRFGNENSAYLFDGIDDYIKVDSVGKYLSNEISVSMWVKSYTSKPQFQLMLCPDNNRFAISINYYHDGMNSIFWDYGWTGAGGDAPGRLYYRPEPFDTLWHHYVFISSTNNGAMKIYKDNSLLVTKNEPLPLLNPENKTLKIGSGDNGYFFNGLIDNIRIYNATISESDVTELYNEEKNGNPLVAYYPFNSNANDESGNGNDGTVNGATLTTDRFGNENSAYLFDGTNDYIDLTEYAPSFNFAEPASFSFWVKSNNDDAQTLFAISDTTLDARITAVFVGNNTTSTISDELIAAANRRGPGDDYITGYTTTNRNLLFDNSWHHIVYVFGESATSIYLDNQFLNLTNYKTNTGHYGNISNPKVTFGTRHNINLGGLGAFFKGSLDDIRVYNKAISQTEIDELYNSEKPSLVAYYPFNGNANDESGNGNNGVSYGGTIITQSAEFDGIDDYVNIGKMSAFNASLDHFTVSFWMKSNYSGKTKYETILKTINDASSGTMFSIETNRGKSAVFTPGAIRLDIRDELDKYFTLYTTQPKIYDDKWHHIVFVVDTAAKNKGDIYIDNMLATKDPYFISQSKNPDNFKPFEHDLVLGAGNNRGTIESYYKGGIDNLRIFNCALTSDDIDSIYNLEKPDEKVALSIEIPDSIVVGDNFEYSILADTFRLEDSVISYQFTLKYDTSRLYYTGYSIAGTVSDGGNVVVNSADNSIHLSYANTNSIVGNGKIIDILFTTKELGDASIELNNLILNTDTVIVTEVSTIKITKRSIIYGDVDYDSSILAYDAALVLQYSVGLDPLPTIDPLPWEIERTIAANVNGTGGITAYDASLILQFTTKRISKFPVESLLKNAIVANISISNDTNFIYFTSNGGLFALNVDVVSTKNVVLKAPVFSNTINAIFAKNFNDSTCKLGLAAVESISDGVEIARIPYNTVINKEGKVTLKLGINEHEYEVGISLLSNGSLTSVHLHNFNKDVNVYPNPASEQITISQENPIYSAFDLINITGEVVQSGKLESKNENIKISSLPKGYYLIRLYSLTTTKLEKLIIK